jgi:hypothetical protein
MTTPHDFLRSIGTAAIGHGSRLSATGGSTGRSRAYCVVSLKLSL